MKRDCARCPVSSGTAWSCVCSKRNLGYGLRCMKLRRGVPRPKPTGFVKMLKKAQPRMSPVLDGSSDEAAWQFSILYLKGLKRSAYSRQQITGLDS